ncbi:MAG: IS701 family transposase [Verrucomicrobiota bacterium]|jgi:SRSO17 transposase
MAWNEGQWEQSAKRLPQFLSPLVQDLGRSERRVGATLYVEGLLMPGQRKSIGPMAERLGVDSQKLQQFITDSPWDESAIWKAIRPAAMDCVEPLEAWIVDETGWLKQGEHSVGVAHQYCGAVGKSANCQVNVQVAITDGLVAVPVGARLYLPESWTKDRARCREAGVPDEVEFATKPQIAVKLIKEALVDGVVPAPVLGDNAYGINGEFRDELRRLGLEFFLQIDPNQMMGWAQPVTVERKRTRWHVVADTPAAPTLLKLFAAHKAVKWRPCSWKAADGQTRHTRLAWMRVYLPGALDRGAQNLEGLWLVVDWPEGAAEAYHYYLAHLHREPTVARCLRLSRSRWNVEQYFQRGKDDLGLDHFEGRSWQGFHHHLVMAVLAYLFVVVIFLSAKKNVTVQVWGRPPVRQFTEPPAP